MALTHVTRLAFGRKIPDGSTVTDDDWRQFEREQISRMFPDGFTVIEAHGGWRDVAAGTAIQEPTVIVEVCHDGGDEALRLLRTLGLVYKIIFRQDAVMMTTLPVGVDFI